MKPAVRQVILGRSGQSIARAVANSPLGHIKSVGVLGDSIARNCYTISTQNSAYVGTTRRFTGRSWASWAAQLSGRRLWCDLYAMEGYSGYTSAQLLAGMLATNATTAIGPTGAQVSIPDGVRARHPDYCFVMIGANDISTSVSSATYIANVKAIWAALRAVGTEPIAISIPPRSAPASFASTVPTFNTALETAAGEEGVWYVDIYTNCDDGSGAWKAGYTYTNNADDVTGLHPGNEGAQSMAADIAAFLASNLPATIYQTPYVLTDALYRIEDGTNDFDGPIAVTLGGGLFPTATGWSARFETGGTSSVGVAAGAPSEVGNALTVTIPGPVGADIYSDRIGPTTYPLVGGAKYGFMCRIEFTAGHVNDQFLLGIQETTTVGATLWAMLNGGSSGDASTITGAGMSERDIYHEFTVPPGISSGRIWLEERAKDGGSGAVLKLAQMGLVRLS